MDTKRNHLINLLDVILRNLCLFSFSLVCNKKRKKKLRIDRQKYKLRHKTQEKKNQIKTFGMSIEWRQGGPYKAVFLLVHW